MPRSPRKAKAKERPLPTHGQDSRSDGVHSRAHGAMTSILDAMDSDSDGGADSDDDDDDIDDDTDTDMGSDDSESSDNDSTTGYLGPAYRLEERLAGRMVWRRRVAKSDDESEDSDDEGISNGPNFFGTYGGPGLVGMRSAVGQSSHQQYAEDEGPRKRRRMEDGYTTGPPLDKDQPAPNAVEIPDFGALLLEVCVVVWLYAAFLLYPLLQFPSTPFHHAPSPLTHHTSTLSP